MVLTANSGTLSAIWSALASLSREASPSARLHDPETVGILHEAAASGWAGILEVETVLLATGVGVPTGSMAGTLAMFGIEPQWVYRRPKATTGAVIGVQRVAAIDLAYLLILVERAGFPADPTPLCQALAPVLRVREFLTGPELAVYWHTRERHRLEPLSLSADAGHPCGVPRDSICTSTGYRAELARSSAGEPSAIRITAPNWRPSRRSLAA